MADESAKGILYLIPHTHWEGAVFTTREKYLAIGLPNILRALALLKAHPSYRFTLDQMCYVKPFLERYPEEAEYFRQCVREGRLGIVGGTDVMLDVNMPGCESFVRQVLYGKRFFREELGVDVTTCWQLDTFGHHAQMPQLLKLAGFRSFWFFRGVPKWETPSEFLWQGIDGTRVPAYWLPHGYALSYGTPRTLPEFGKWVLGLHGSLDRFSAGSVRVAPGGADVCEPEEHLAGLVDEYGDLPDAPLTLRIATPADYEQAVPIGDGAPVLACELNPIFQGIYSSRIELKQWTRELESLLTTAEKLGVLLSSVGEPVEDDILARAWEPMLFNQAHDLMSGVMTDHVYEDTVNGYAFSRRIAVDEGEARLRRYCAKVDTRGAGIPLVVFNALGWPRTDAVRAQVGFGEPGVTGIELLDAEGRSVPVQIVKADRLPSGGIVAAEIAFIADEIPALGHSVYRIIPRHEGDAGAGAAREETGEAALDGEACRVTVDARTGAVSSLLHKPTGWDALSAPGNIVVREEDRGDLWEPYRPLDGGSRIAMREPHPIPPRGEAVYSDEQPAAAGRLTTGLVFSELTVEHQFGENGTFGTTIRLYRRLPRIEIRTRILNNERFVRYRAVFPTSLREGRGVHEIPFGAIERPHGIEFPAQNWVDLSDGARGLALLNRGLPGNAILDGAMLLSLVRSTQIVAYGFGGGYEPGMTSETGFELGKRMDFDYALVPHSGDWADAAVYREGQALNCPLIALTAAPHAGVLPSRSGWFGVEPGNVMTSAAKMASDGVAVLRLYEASGRSTPGARVRLPVGTVRVEIANLLEEALEPVSIADGVATLDFGPYEIKTLRVTI